MNKPKGKTCEKHINNFKRTKDFILCIDSDGCAMDTMTVKHSKCFAPCFVNQFGLQENEKYILKRWSEINLFSRHRGINRFKGAAIILSDIEEYTCGRIKIEGLSDYINWIKNTKQYSNEALKQYSLVSKNPLANKILQWSYNVNEAILNLSLSEKPAFKGVKDALKFASVSADIAVVSSANKSAILSEWKNTKLLNYPSLVFAQEDGTKTECLKKLIALDYIPSKTMMIGDSLSDLKAAEDTGVLFYPIIPGNEENSWKELLNIFLPDFFAGNYTDSTKKALIVKMKNILA
ncbi:MAG: phosphoglycolate phosphatase [Treponema sp.]|nr:MAG: phosphoglycolate phosphatase [Treponema sp.]